MSDTQDPAAAERAWRKFAAARFVMLLSSEPDGTPYGCPMTVQHDDGGLLWMFTAADTPSAQHIARDPRVMVVVMDGDDSFYVAAKGRAQVSNDRERMRQLFNPMVKAWFPRGLDDPQLRLLRVELTQAEYWDSASSKLVRMASMAKALVSGERPHDIGAHGTLDPQRGHAAGVG
jgi:general stress protein 26